MGKRFLAVTHAVASDTQGLRYGWASVLLGASGSTAYFAANEYTGDTWSSEYEVQLGSPTSGAIAIPNGAWKRTFSNGIVVVNPTTSKLSVGFGGSYSGSGLVNATGATLASHTALILSKATGTSQGGGEGSTPEAESPETAPTPESGAPSEAAAPAPSSESGTTAEGSSKSEAESDSEAEPGVGGNEAARCRRALRAHQTGKRTFSPRHLRRCRAVVRAVSHTPRVD
jgi:hypothetical protein